MLDFIKAAASLIFSPIDSIWGIIKGLTNMARGNYFSSRTPDDQLTDPSGAHKSPIRSTVWGGRVLSTLFAGLCIALFITAIFAPIPGITPLYTLTVGAIAKVSGFWGIAGTLGITAAWTTAGKVLGSCIGMIFDYNRQGMMMSKPKALRIVVQAGLFGESSKAARDIFQKIKGFFGRTHSVDPGPQKNKEHQQKEKPIISSRPEKRDSTPQLYKQLSLNPSPPVPIPAEMKRGSALDPARGKADIFQLNSPTANSFSYNSRASELNDDQKEEMPASSFGSLP